jgi:peptidoglycan biosynthesis protein MviN/MurJ (putative lipid II flippase)
MTSTSKFDSEPSGDPGELLRSVAAAKRDIRSNTPKEWKVFLLWGIWVLVFVAPFDFLNGNVWWPVVVVASVAGGVATTVYFVSRSRRLHWHRMSTWRNWLTIFIVYGMVMATAVVVQSHFRYTWAAAAIVAAVPYFLTALVIHDRDQRHVAS